MSAWLTARSNRWWTWCVGALTLLGELVRVFVPSPVGLTDNSDQARILCGLGIPATAHADLWRYLRLKFTAESGARCADHYTSTQYWFVWAASRITRLFEPGVTLDIRVLGVAQLTAVAALCGLIVAALRSLPARLLAAAVLFLMVDDSVAADYALTAYSESAEIVGLLAACAGTLWWVRGARAAVRIGALILLTFGLIVLLGAKTQLLPVLPLAIVLLFAVRAKPIGRRWSARVCAGSVSAAVLAALAVAPPTSDARLTLMNRTDFVFVALLPTSRNPAADLSDLGLPARLAAWQGKDYWCVYHPGAPNPDLALADRRLGYGRIGGFLIGHPEQALSVAQSAAEQALSAWPTYQTCTGRDLLGAHTAQSGAAPGTPDTRIVLESGFLRLLSPLGLGGLALLWLMSVAALVVRRRRRTPGAACPLDALAWFSLALSVAQFLIAAFGDGIDDAKHALLTPFGALLAILFSALSWIEARKTRARAVSPGSGDDAANRPAAAQPV